MGDERQPRKGKIYGRKDGRFMSKAKIVKYYVKKKRSFKGKVKREPQDSTNAATNEESSTDDEPKSVNQCTNKTDPVLVTGKMAKYAVKALKLYAESVNRNAAKPKTPTKCCRERCSCHPEEPDRPLPAMSVGVRCNKEYCRLGCVCDSIIGATIMRSIDKRKDHCGRPECMFGCVCLPQARHRSRQSIFAGQLPPDFVAEQPLQEPQFTAPPQPSIFAGQRSDFASNHPTESNDSSTPFIPPGDIKIKEEPMEDIKPMNITNQFTSFKGISFSDVIRKLEARKSNGSDLKPPKRKRRKRCVGSMLEDDDEFRDKNSASYIGQVGVRKSDRIVDRPRFSDIENLKSLIYFDTSFWEGENKTKKKKVPTATLR